MKLKMSLLLLCVCGLSCGLLTAAGAESQVQVESLNVVKSGAASPGQMTLAESNTDDYVHGWTSPTSENSVKPANPDQSKASRERMLPSETDSFKRAWTFPTDAEGDAAKSPVPSGSRPDSPKAPPPSDTQEYLKGWTSD